MATLENSNQQFVSGAEGLGDQSLKEPSFDALGYAPFAENLATAISRVDPAGGMVLALYGSWGSGKSTVLNFVQSFLVRQNKQMPIVRFNPWWFAGQEELMRFFFEELANSLSLQSFSDTTKQKALDWVGLALRFSGKVFSKVPALTGIAHISPETLALADVTALAPAIGAGMEQIGKDLKTLVSQPLEKTRSLIEEKLRLIADKILIIIDDIDRLTAEEIRHMFRVIKAVANFGNVIYLLAFDKRVVIAALGTEQVSGEDYLAKIVQVPFELPLPEPRSLRRMLESRLEPILRSTPQWLRDPQEWSQTYEPAPLLQTTQSGGLWHFINTPRDVVRLTNCLALTYSSVQNEVNAADFITIEWLRVSRPAVYDLIRRNGYWYCSGNSSLMPPDGGSGGTLTPEAFPFPVPDSFRAFHESSLNALVESGQLPAVDLEPLKSLLIQMFPRLIPLWPPRGFRIDYIARFRRRGICFADLFSTYFRLTPPEGRLSQSEIVRLCNDPRLLRVKLTESEDAKPVSPFSINQVLLEIERNVAAIPDDVVEPMVRVLFEQEGLHRGNSLVWTLLGRLAQPNRVALLGEVLNQDLELPKAVELLLVLGEPYVKLPTGGTPLPLNYRAFGRDPERPIVNDVELSTLQQLLAARIIVAAENGSLLEESELLVILRGWYSFGDRSTLETWALNTGRDLKQMIRVLERFLQLVPKFGPPGMGNRESDISIASAEPSDERYTISIERVELFGEPRVIAEKLLKTDQSGFSAKQRLAIRVLARECGLRKKMKGNPFR